jgi:hypothetical protein
MQAENIGIILGQFLPLLMVQNDQQKVKVNQFFPPLTLPSLCWRTVFLSFSAIQVS